MVWAIIEMDYGVCCILLCLFQLIIRLQCFVLLVGYHYLKMTSPLCPKFAQVVLGVFSSPLLHNTTIKHQVESFCRSHPRFSEEFWRRLCSYIHVYIPHSGDILRSGFVKSVKAEYPFSNMYSINRTNGAEGSQWWNLELHSVVFDKPYANSTFGGTQQIQLAKQKFSQSAMMLPSTNFSSTLAVWWNWQLDQEKHSQAC